MFGKKPLLSALLLFPLTAQAGQSSFPHFDSWFEKYRAAKWIHPTGPDEKLEKGLQELLAADNPAAAQRALSLACFRFHPDARIEKEQYAAQQPWTLRETAVETLGRFRDPEALQWLTTEILLGKSQRGQTERVVAARALGLSGHSPSLLGILAALGDESWEVRAAAADAAGHFRETQASVAIAHRLRADEEAPVRVRCLEALAASFDPRHSSFSSLDRQRIVATVAARLADADWRVRVAAADFFAQRPDPKVLSTLIQALREEKRLLAEGLGRKRAFYAILEALARTAGKTVSASDPEAWQSWWDKNREGFVMTTRTASAEAPTGIPYYFGIPVRSDRVLFLLDISGSMEGGGGASKLARAKQEVIGVIERLGPRDRFNVILFENAVYPVFDGAVPATPENVQTARQRILAARAGGGTNLFGAIETALRIAQPNTSNSFAIDIDTAFLLSDGAPSTGLLIDPKAILAAVAAANATSRVAIHTISLFKDEPQTDDGTEWMEALAKRNFGEYRRIEVR